MTTVATATATRTREVATLTATWRREARHNPFGTAAANAAGALTATLAGYGLCQTEGCWQAAGHLATTPHTHRW